MLLIKIRPYNIILRQVMQQREFLLSSGEVKKNKKQKQQHPHQKKHGVFINVFY
jgi:hypothetical protein